MLGTAQVEPEENASQSGRAWRSSVTLESEIEILGENKSKNGGTLGVLVLFNGLRYFFKRERKRPVRF